MGEITSMIISFQRSQRLTDDDQRRCQFNTADLYQDQEKTFSVCIYALCANNLLTGGLN